MVPKGTRMRVHDNMMQEKIDLIELCGYIYKFPMNLT